MKSTVFTVMTVLLLMATLCLPAAAQRWQQINAYSAPIDADEWWENGISDIAFRDNHQVFFGKGSHLFKWDLSTRGVWEVDHGGRLDPVSSIAIPRHSGSVVIYGYGGRGRGRLNIRRTDNLSFIAGAQIYDWLATYPSIITETTSLGTPQGGILMSGILPLTSGVTTVGNSTETT